MERNRGSGLAGGIVLILLGLLWLAANLVPGLQVWIGGPMGWPVIVVAVGVFLLILGVLVGAPGMAVPAAIVGGIGGLLYWQNLTGNWESWSYAWALIPGFVGVGIILSGLLQGRVGRSFDAGLWLVVISTVLFLVFGSFLGGQNMLGPYWPVLLIVLGALLLLRPLLRRR